jgi:FKBP-type peptidyl-prolyl cis-trans isomerase FkpA
LKLKTWFAVAALAVAAACSGDSTGSNPGEIGPPPSLPAGADTVTTTSGLKYVDIALGAGAAAQAGDHVSLHYTLWLSNGTAIGTTKGGAPQIFVVGDPQLIAGFNEGLKGMEVGGKRRLIIPPSLGYGSNPQLDQSGRVVIPANSTLIFDVELVSIAH